MMKSVVSYPDRGKFGNNKYRGNCSGKLIQDLLNQFKPKKFIEIFAGGGTGYDVARAMGYEDSLHLDLNPRFGGWNALRMDVPIGSDFTFSHPPYHDIIHYSGEMWGDEPHPDDLSRCQSYEDFIKKLNFVNAKIYDALRRGGRHAILIGDIRKKRKYYSIIKDMIWYGDLESHVIKVQHNCYSDHIKYSGNFIPIVHEHLLIFRKNEIWAIPLTVTKKAEKSMKENKLATWRDLVQTAMESLGGKSNLKALYEILSETRKAKENKNWQAKIRQTLQIYDEFEQVKRGEWRLTFSSLKTA